MFDFDKVLNRQQLQAVEEIYGPMLIIAGAGSGKTRVIEYRVLKCILSDINPSSILLLTFTRKASKEMLSRATQHDPRCNYVSGGTFHSFGYRLLKIYSSSIGIDGNFTILDQGDIEQAIGFCVEDLEIKKINKRFPKNPTLAKIFSRTINKNCSIEDVLDDEYPHYSEYSNELEKIKDHYIKYKLKHNYIDYDDLLLYTILLLEKDDIRKRISEKYKFIMVDEYQDTNHLQGRITYLLGMEHQNVVVVGDDAQSIYGFRGATHENIMEYPKLFENTKIIKLEQNYRSTQSILQLSNTILETMIRKYRKDLKAASEETGQKPKLLEFKNDQIEAEQIVDEIIKNREEGMDLEDQAVLFRSSFVSIPVQLELKRRNIPFQFFGGKKFNETAHVKDIMAHLKIYVNTIDRLSWDRVLRLIPGIGPKKASRVIESIVNSNNLKIILSNILPDFGKTIKKSADIIMLTDTLKVLMKENVTIEEKVQIICDYYKPLMKEKYDDWNKRISDLTALQQIASTYNNIQDYISDLSIEAPETTVTDVEPLKNDEKPLTLSTIHSAKGLEWSAVFIVGLADGQMPSMYSLNNDENIEEEKRLLYVAVTRAKKKLYLTFHHTGYDSGVSNFEKMSRFLDYKEILDCLDLASISKPNPFKKTKSELKGMTKEELLEKLQELQRNRRK
ncbi:MAG: ATP-dependent helicase UvrD/PcrA [Kosmotogales bacterium]|nr:ATP-dependent helicase UvrD/PcrA [Kosmotogales bacterium]